jgi:hypothetical protein
MPGRRLICLKADTTRHLNIYHQREKQSNITMNNNRDLSAGPSHRRARTSLPTERRRKGVNASLTRPESDDEDKGRAGRLVDNGFLSAARVAFVFISTRNGRSGLWHVYEYSLAPL